MKSPCRKLCGIDQESGLCMGCGRTLDEIQSWINMDDAERGRVLSQLDTRMAHHFGRTKKPVNSF